VLSVLSVILESVPSIRASYGFYLQTVGWIFTGLFTMGYAARLATVKNPKRYSLTFFGIVDLLAIAPIYLSVLFSVEHSYAIVRSLRLAPGVSHIEAYRVRRRGGSTAHCPSGEPLQDNRISPCGLDDRHHCWRTDV
jgi:hypothetical protein